MEIRVINAGLCSVLDPIHDTYSVYYIGQSGKSGLIRLDENPVQLPKAGCHVIGRRGTLVSTLCTSGIIHVVQLREATLQVLSTDLHLPVKTIFDVWEKRKAVPLLLVENASTGIISVVQMKQTKAYVPKNITQADIGIAQARFDKSGTGFAVLLSTGAVFLADCKSLNSIQIVSRITDYAHTYCTTFLCAQLTTTKTWLLTTHAMADLVVLNPTVSIGVLKLGSTHVGMRRITSNEMYAGKIVPLAGMESIIAYYTDLDKKWHLYDLSTNTEKGNLEEQPVCITPHTILSPKRTTSAIELEWTFV